MNDVAGMPALALILFAPWFLILSALYWLYPRQPRATRAGAVSMPSPCCSPSAACLASLHWSFGLADRGHGHLWPQVLATSVGYGVFLAVLTAAVLLRRRLFNQSLRSP